MILVDSLRWSTLTTFFLWALAATVARLARVRSVSFTSSFTTVVNLGREEQGPRATWGGGAQ